MNESTPSDSDLVQKCRQGDEQAFEQLYFRYRRQLYGYLNRVLPGNPAVVDDVYQQTWIKVLDSLPRYREQQRFVSWLFRVAHNLAVDHFRDQARRDEVLVDTRLPAPGGAPWERMDRTELRSAIDSAVAALPTEQREVFLLRQQQVPFKDIAEIQQTSLNTVLGRMHYAVGKLQRVLAGWR